MLNLWCRDSSRPIDPTDFTRISRVSPDTMTTTTTKISEVLRFAQFHLVSGTSVDLVNASFNARRETSGPSGMSYYLYKATNTDLQALSRVTELKEQLSILEQAAQLAEASGE